MFPEKTQHIIQKRNNRKRLLVLLRNKFMVQICIFFCTITLPNIAKAQFGHMLDSIKYYMQFKPTLIAKFDGKNTFVSGRGVPIKGFELGITYKNKISYMAGIYFLGKPFYSKSTLYQGTIREITYDTRIRIFYGSLIAEYSILKNHKWTINMPFQIGIGSARKIFYENKAFIMSKQSTIFPVELSFTGNYRIWKFVGLSGGLGYRRAFGANNIKDEDFNGIIYNLGIKIWLDSLCYWIAPDCALCKEL